VSKILNPYRLESNPLLVVVSGTSGAGKDMLLKRVKERGLPYRFVVTTTDRPSRPGEVNGVDYFFVSTQEFERMIENDELLEHAIVYGQYKGISKAQVHQALESGQDVIMRIDVQGAATIRELAPEALLIFVSAESEGALEARLIARKSDSEEELRTRLLVAAQEIERLSEFDYVVINRTDELDEAVDMIVAIIKAEKHRVRQRRVNL